MIPDWPASSLFAAAVIAVVLGGCALITAAVLVRALAVRLAAPAVRCCRWCRTRADRTLLAAVAWRTSRDTPHPNPPRHRGPA